MTVVLVNGNPETPAVWGPLVAELGRDDVVTLGPPGFGSPVPTGFGATADEYLAWLEAEVAAMGEPVHLIGHDWGANHTLRLACARPDLIRSWCTDTAGTFSGAYVWHEGTKAWRTPGEGEAAVDFMLGLGPEGRATLFVSLGMTSPTAEVLAAAFDEDMGRSILRLYRSVGQDELARWSEPLEAAAARPGLVLVPTGDVYTGEEALHRRVASRTGADVVVLDGLGHWWLLEDPVRGAEALRSFLARVDDGA